MTVRIPRLNLGWFDITMTWPLAALALDAAAFDTDGNIVIDPKIADNSNSFFITSPFRIFLRESEKDIAICVPQTAIC